MNRLINRSLIALVSCCLLITAAHAASPRVGEFYPSEEGGASLQSNAETIRSGERVVRASSGGMLHLVNGRVVQMSANSAAIYDLRGDAVKVQVLSGTVRGVGEDGRLLVAGSGSRFTLLPDENPSDQVEARLLEQPYDRRAPRRERVQPDRSQRSSKSTISGR